MKLHSVKFLTLTIVMLAAHGAYSKVLAIDDCGECMGPKAKLVEGGPDKKPFKELVAATKKPIEIARTIASDKPIIINKSVVQSKAALQRELCYRLVSAAHTVDIETIFEKIDESPYSEDFNDFWTKPDCESKRIVDSKVPLMFNVADDVIRMEKFPKFIYEYFLEERNDKEAWLGIINTKSSDGYTFLDYLQYHFDNKHFSNPSLAAAANRIVEFVCKNGGTYSKYSQTSKCQ